MNKDQAKERIKEAKGKVKEGAGKLVGNDKLEVKGKTQYSGEKPRMSAFWRGGNSIYCQPYCRSGLPLIRINFVKLRLRAYRTAGQ